MPKEITHERRLCDVSKVLDRFLAEIAGLGSKLGPLLVQMPPSLAFEEAVARSFFDELRARFTADVVCEPRHATWFARDADRLLAEYRVARVAADPAVVPRAAEPGGWSGLAYYRLHGSPKMYYSSYSSEFLESLAAKLRETVVPAWCIFDNTTLGAATINAVDLLGLNSSADRVQFGCNR